MWLDEQVVKSALLWLWHRLLATGGSDALICIWDLQQCVPSTIIYKPDDPVRGLSFNADASLLAYCQGDPAGQPSSVEVVDVKTGKLCAPAV